MCFICERRIYPRWTQKGTHMTQAHENGYRDSPGLGWFEKYIYLWIIVAGLGGLLAGRAFPTVATAIERVSWQGVSLPLAAAMFFVMLPPMARIKCQFAPVNVPSLCSHDVPSLCSRMYQRWAGGETPFTRERRQW